MKRTAIISTLVVLLLTCATVYAQIPDGETLAHEGVCDDLMYATPGLYGLCIAFCEAQDCQPDWSLEDPFADCKPSSPQLLEIYNRKKRSGDPDMPCVRNPCPCWSEEEILSHDIASCIGTLCWKCLKDSDDDYRHYTNKDLIIWQYGYSHTFSIRTQQRTDNEAYECKFWDHNESLDDSHYVDRHYTDLTLEEFLYCESELNEWGATWGVYFWD